MFGVGGGGCEELVSSFSGLFSVFLRHGFLREGRGGIVMRVSLKV